MDLLHCHSGNLWGGVERALEALALADPVGQRFALCFPGPFAERLKEMGQTPLWLGSVRFRFPWTTWRARRRLGTALREQPPRCILTHSLWALCLAQRVARRQKVPVAYWAHDVLTGDHPLERAARVHPPDLLLANSAFTASRLPRVFGDRPVAVLPPPLTPGPTLGAEQRREFRQRRGVDDDTVVLLMAARFEPLKGHDLLVEALAQLPRSLRWRCWVVGEPQRDSERDWLRTWRTKAESLERVDFIGSQGELAPFYESADVYCQPNREPESFGLTFAEAAWHGLPVVTSHLGAAPEWITAQTGRLLPPGDTEALAHTLTELLQSPQLREDLGRGARAAARRFHQGPETYTRLRDLLGLGATERAVSHPHR